MNYRILFFLVLLFLFSCGTSKKHSEQMRYSYLLTDSSLFRGTGNRVVSEQVLSRHICLAAPDSSGRQAIVSLTETRLVRAETDSIFMEQENKIAEKGIIDHSIQQTRETTPSVPVLPLVWFSIVVLFVYLIFRRFSR